MENAKFFYYSPTEATTLHKFVT